MDSVWQLAGLFASAFLSATILPGVSEAVLIAVQQAEVVPVTIIVLVATLGNTTGSILNWLIGRFGARYRHHRRFPISPVQFARMEDWFRKYGVWALLMSWAPFIGDAMTIVAGFLRTPLWLFVPLVFLGKGVRYVFVAGIGSLF